MFAYDEFKKKKGKVQCDLKMQSQITGGAIKKKWGHKRIKNVWKVKRVSSR